jgi:D-arabinose 5-phosphate isomerase GutQ
MNDGELRAHLQSAAGYASAGTFHVDLLMTYDGVVVVGHGKSGMVFRRIATWEQIEDEKFLPLHRLIDEVNGELVAA